MAKIVYLAPDEHGVRWSECGQYWRYWGFSAHGCATYAQGPASHPPDMPPGFRPDMKPEKEDDPDDASFYPSRDSLPRLLRGRQSRTPEAIQRLTRHLLTIELDGRLDWGGGYSAEVDWDTFPDLVVIADLDPAKEYRRPILVYYVKEKLYRLTRDALDEGPIDHDGRRLRGEERAEAIFDYFCEKLSECGPFGEEAESEPDPAEGEAR
jgi:hypothetical protein